MYPPGKRPLVLMLLSLLLAGSAFGYSFDDDIPEINAPVARLTYVRGNVQVRRADSEEWERAVTNLPIVEGDEIVADNDSRFEIQFAVDKFLRADELTSVRLLTLKDEGVAVSVPQGNVSVRLNDLDSSAEFFEIDAPRSTIALQSKGTYRIDAGQAGASAVRISVFEGGEARVYSSTSGFTLRSGRTARVFIEGRLDGEWELGDSDSYADAFDRWSADRDESISENQRDSYYGSYYDEDIYGADELDEYGDWVYAQDYGYIWRPYSSSISSYSDWSPYRYGQWRWVPPYGWTWVNDEPWGWATYHYGRWIWYNGYWHWAPYGYDRYGRSWWRPAMVVFTTYGNNYCWYPLDYYSPYYNYNYHYYAGSNYRRRRNWGGNQNPAPAPTPPAKVSSRVPRSTPILTPEQRQARRTTPPLQNIPPTGVVTASKDEFANGRGAYRRPPLSTAREVLSKAPVEAQTPPILPTYEEAGKRLGRDVRVERPVVTRPANADKTGATTRTDQAPLDNRLKNTRMLGNRPPLEVNTPQGEVKTAPGVTPGRPRTGGVDRPAGQTPPLIERPATPPAEEKQRETPSYPQQQRRPQPPLQPTPRQETPRYEPPKQETPRYDPPPQRRPEPPLQRERPRSEPPRRETPRYEPPPQKSEPPSRPAPAPKNDPPPKKSEPSKPAPSPPLQRGGGSKKDPDQ
ncbi:MAG: hypothetical protein QUS14_15290 [Pyrinomonadaceae bacterium]|nr:hypothetical protein [Pyrinomonadaceae bacterium]